MTPLERAACALHCDGDAEQWNAMAWVLKNAAIEDVRAVLLAVREPTPDMIAEAVSEYVGDIDAENTWQAMIDKLLEGE